MIDFANDFSDQILIHEFMALNKQPMALLKVEYYLSNYCTICFLYIYIFTFNYSLNFHDIWYDIELKINLILN